MKNKESILNHALEPLSALVGQWKTIGVHPFIPDNELHGYVNFEWIEGGAFLKMSSTIEHPQFPDGIVLFGSDDKSGQIFMLYFDQRGISRKYDFSIEGNQWKWWRDNPEFSQRFTVDIEDNGNKMTSKGEMCRDGSTWEKDLDLVYTRIQ